MIVNFLTGLFIFVCGYLIGGIVELKKNLKNMEAIEKWAEDHGYIERD